MKNNKKDRQDLARLGMETGSQIKRRRMPHKQSPEWAGSLESIEAFLLRPARKNVRCAYLFWVVGTPAREIAEELGETEGAVKQLLARLRRK